MKWWEKAKDWLTGEPENQSHAIVPYQAGRYAEDRLPVRGGKQDINTVDDTTDMFKDAPPELIQCILEGGIINVRGKSFEEVKAIMKQDPNILGATFTMTDENGAEHGKVIVWRKGQVKELDRQKSIGKSNVRQIER